nr:cytochrome C oxidase Cbb3 [Gammaproteobacteria bacterium]
MWISGVMQGLMWRAVNPDGSLAYSFIEVVQATHPYYVVRFLGGVFFLSGMVVMAYNVWRTVVGSKPVPVVVAAPAH